MIVSFNPTISNKKNSSNFGKVNQQLLTDIQKDPVGAINNKVQSALMFKKVPKQDIIDTLTDALSKINQTYHAMINKRITSINALA